MDNGFVPRAGCSLTPLLPQSCPPLLAVPLVSADPGSATMSQPSVLVGRGLYDNVSSILVQGRASLVKNRFSLSKGSGMTSLLEGSAGVSQHYPHPPPRAPPLSPPPPSLGVTALVASNPLFIFCFLLGVSFLVSFGGNLFILGLAKKSLCCCRRRC